MVKVAVLEKLLGTGRVLKLKELIDASPQFTNLFKIQRLFTVTNKTYLQCLKNKNENKNPQYLGLWRRHALQEGRPLATRSAAFHPSQPSPGARV